MEVPATGYAPGAYASTPYAATFSTLQASSSVSVDLPGGLSGGMSITIANQVDMMYGQITQGGGVDPQTLKALILLLLVQLLLNGGFDEQTQQLLQGLGDALTSAGRTDMSMVAMQASSMIQIDLGGPAAATPTAGGINVLA